MPKYGLRHHWLTATRMGKLTPFFMAEVSPGEVFHGSTSGLIRLAPIQLPAFTQIRLHANIFYVPYRILLDEFPEMWTGEDTTTPWPTITYSAIGTLWHYFGIRAISLQSPVLNAFPVYAYNAIWNSHYRNALLQNEVALNRISGDLLQVHHNPNEYYGSIQTELAQGGSTSEQVTVSGGVWDVVDYRDAMNRQRYKERRALYGEKYEDVLRVEHGVDISDVRLSRPELVASGHATMGISEVVATASSTSENTGEYKGHGITGLRINMRKRKFPEPGILMGCVYARPRLQLMNRIDKMFLTQDIEELYQPHLVTDTQQIVSSGEVYSEAASYTNFGYVGKFDHLRTARDTIAGFGEINDYALFKELTSTPTVTVLQQVAEHDNIFQDQTNNRADFRMFFDHRIGKTSPIPRRKK